MTTVEEKRLAKQAWDDGIARVAATPKPSFHKTCSDQNLKSLQKLLKIKEPEKYSKNGSKWIQRTINEALTHARNPSKRKAKNDASHANEKAKKLTLKEKDPAEYDRK